MEGAAVAFTAARLGVPAFVEVRVISNRTGADPGWDIAAALATLRTVASSL
jgi:nucleoside phosphorylase